MNVWNILPDANTYRSFHVVGLSPGEILDKTNAFRNGNALGTAWMPLRVELFEFEGEVEKPIGDFPSLVGTPLAISVHALEVLYPLIRENVEVLDLITHVGKFHALNVFTCECLDHSSSELVRFSDGNIMGVEKYAFHPECLREKHIFRIPEIWGSTFVDDAFKQMVEQNGLQGLVFNQVL